MISFNSAGRLASRFNRLIMTGSILLLVIAGSVHGQIKVMNFDRLSIQNATQIAMENNPSLSIASAGYDISNALLRQARSNFYPVIGFTATGSRTEGAFVLNPQFPVREQQYNNYTAVLQVTQLVWDFGRTTSRVEANRNFTQASDFDYKAAVENVIVSVQTAYYTYLETQYVEKVNLETLQQAQEHLRIAQAFFNAGRRAQYDVTKAEVDVANANVSLLRSRNQVQIARLQLENAMGIKNSKDYVVTDSLSAPRFSVSLDSAVAIAIENRSEMKSAQLRLEANRNLVSSTWDQNLPALSVFGSYNWNGFNFPLASRWNAGVTLSVPLFQGFAVSAQVQQNEANVAQASASIEVTKQNIILDVSQNYLALNEAFQRIDASNTLVRSADENLRLATGRYNSGVGSPTEITDAQLLLANARITYIQALYDYNTSMIKLKKSMGTIREK
ncbi:MAG: TolC family protein [Ignavibacteriales bacterium]